MKLKLDPPVIQLWPFVNGRLGCEGKPREYPSDLVFRMVKRKKKHSLIRHPHAGFAWVNNSDLIQNHA